MSLVNINLRMVITVGTWFFDFAFGTKAWSVEGASDEGMGNVEKQVIQAPAVNYLQGRAKFSQLFSFLCFR